MGNNDLGFDTAKPFTVKATEVHHSIDGQLECGCINFGSGGFRCPQHHVKDKEGEQMSYSNEANTRLIIDLDENDPAFQSKMDAYQKEWFENQPESYRKYTVENRARMHVYEELRKLIPGLETLGISREIIANHARDFFRESKGETDET